MIDLDELERLCREATPGPWPTHPPRVYIGELEGRAAYVDFCNTPNGEANAALIAALRNAAPELIAMARRLEWIEKNVLCIDTASDPDNLVRVWFADGSGGFKVASGRTLADAINAAMKEKR